MQNIDSLINFAKEQLRSINKESGRILYSSVDTLCPAAVYILGLNPGGSPIAQASETIGKSIDALPSKKDNYYLDEVWFTNSRSFSKGQAPLQLRVVWLLQKLGLNPRSVAASNLIFARSEKATGIQFEQYANICWPVHEKILDIVKPKLLLVFGNSNNTPYSFLKEKYGINSETLYPSGHGDWMCRGFVVPELFTVVGLPHLSRYKIISHADVVDWINSIVKL